MYLGGHHSNCQNQHVSPININLPFENLQDSEMETENNSFSILMFPWLAHGHIFPFLELAKGIIERRTFHIYFCSTAINFGSIKKFIDKNSLNDCVELVELHLEPSTELPPHYHTTKNLPQNLNSTLLRAFQTSRSSFSNIVGALSPDLVIYDSFQPWAPKIASSQGIPAIHFCTVGAATMSFIHHQFTFGEADFPFPAIHIEDHELKNLAALCHQKLVPVGPLVSDNYIQNDEEKLEIIDWLSKKNPQSTVFISFGSEYFLSKAEIDETAKALELCDVNFIWVIRFPIGVTVSIEESLPQGFLDRVGQRGMIVTGWAPQAHILAHTNTGGFVSHCGWSSVMESMYFGIPVIAMPMWVDQPLNAEMLAEAGSCVKVGRNGDGRYKGEEIANAIKKVFSKGSGDNLRRRARELSGTIRAGKEPVLDETASQLWQICLKHKLQLVMRFESLVFTLVHQGYEIPSESTTYTQRKCRIPPRELDPAQPRNSCSVVAKYQTLFTIG